MIDILNNPVIIGMLVGIITYMYLWWKNEEEYKKNPRQNRKTSIAIPVATSIVSFLLAYGTKYFDKDNQSGGGVPEVMKDDMNISESFKLVSKGVNIPNNLKIPDVFIETQ
jgi:hypothetical protein